MLNALRSVGRIETGHVAEQRVQVWDAHGCAHLFRRIQMKLDQATRDGERVLDILTNIPLRNALATRIARLYRKRWTLERMFGWLNRSRRLRKDFEAVPETTETWIRIAMIHLMVRRLAARA